MCIDFPEGARPERPRLHRVSADLLLRDAACCDGSPAARENAHRREMTNLDTEPAWALADVAPARRGVVQWLWKVNSGSRTITRTKVKSEHLVGGGTSPMFKLTLFITQINFHTLTLMSVCLSVCQFRCLTWSLSLSLSLSLYAYIYVYIYIHIYPRDESWLARAGRPRLAGIPAVLAPALAAEAVAVAALVSNSKTDIMIHTYINIYIYIYVYIYIHIHIYTHLIYIYVHCT